MIDCHFVINEPANFQKICKVYSPTIRQVITEENFLVYRKLLTLSQEEIEDEYMEKEMELSNVLTPLEYLLNSSFNNKQVEALSIKAFEFFIHEPVSFIYEEKKILVGDLKKILEDAQSLDDLRFLTSENFFDFQNLIRNSVGEDSIDPPNPNEHPKIKKMKAKARYRDKIKAKKEGLTLDTLLISICCMGIGITPLTVGELSYATFSKLIGIYQEKEKYEVDIRSLLAGASSKDVKPKYWIHNSDKKQEEIKYGFYPRQIWYQGSLRFYFL